ELLDEIMTLIVAGHETTASSLNWFWHRLAQHPSAQERLHEEAAREDEQPSYEALAPNLGTRRMVDETLRLYPPGWLLTRRSIGRARIGDLDLPAGTDVVISPYLVHRHPRYWRDGDRFDP